MGHETNDAKTLLLSSAFIRTFHVVFRAEFLSIRLHACRCSSGNQNCQESEECCLNFLVNSPPGTIIRGRSSRNYSSRNFPPSRPYYLLQKSAIKCIPRMLVQNAGDYSKLRALDKQNKPL